MLLTGTLVKVKAKITSPVTIVPVLDEVCGPIPAVFLIIVYKSYHDFLNK